MYIFVFFLNYSQFVYLKVSGVHFFVYFLLVLVSVVVITSIYDRLQ